LSKANRQIETTIREIKEANAEKEKTKEVRRKLEDFKESIQNSDTINKDELAKEYRKLKTRENELSHKRPDLKKKSKQLLKEKTEPVQDTIFRLGDSVKIEGQESIGELIEIRGKQGIVVFGNIKSNVKIDRLIKVKQEPGPVSVKQSNVNLGDWNVSKRRTNFKSEIDLRGRRAEEALKNVNEFIDEAIMVGATEVRILHGKGDGILRHLIRDLLQSNDVVASYADEHIERGGAGITVVRFSF
jgi:DNA mismatch repair protein MutS2